MTSIRTRIILAVVGSTALVVAVAALSVGAAARAMLVTQLDDRLRARARWFTTVLRPPPRGASDERDGGERRDFREGREGRDGRTGREDRDGRDPRELPPSLEPQQPPPQQFIEVRDAESGEEIQRSPALPSEISLASFGVRPGDPIRTIQLPDERSFRLLAIESGVRTWGRSRDAGREGPREREAATTWIALDASETEREVRNLAWILAAVWAGATVLSWVVAASLSRTVLRPVDGVSRTIASLSPTNLSSRVPMETVPAELSAVVNRLNALLEKLEAAFRRERATIANMAHELRNPLSALRTTLEFGLFQGLSPQHRRTLESSLALAIRMQGLVNGLLTLTRIEAGQEVLAREEVDVARVMREAWSTLESRAGERGLTAAWSVPDSLALVTSPTHLELVAANLLDNAVSHGAAPGSIEIELERDEAAARLRISNGCAGTRDRAGFFEPFWRSDPARSDERHAGLGLALCDRIVRLLGGTIDAQQQAGRFTVTVTIPAAEVTAAPVGAP